MAYIRKSEKQLSILENAEIVYHDFGKIMQGKKKLYDYYKVDSLSKTQYNELIKNGAIVKTTQSEYAPELKRAIICFS